MILLVTFKNMAISVCQISNTKNFNFLLFLILFLALIVLTIIFHKKLILLIPCI